MARAGLVDLLTQAGMSSAMEAMSCMRRSTVWLKEELALTETESAATLVFSLKAPELLPVTV
jgi:hypothetical protein